VELNSLNQILVYANDVNLLGDNISTVKSKAEVLLQASKEISLEVRVFKTNCRYLTVNQNKLQP
jgi:hypothetical protein